MDNFAAIPPREPRSGLVHVIVDTPRGSRNKLKYDETLRCFRLSRILPLGFAFPYEFGSIPGTRAQDGDALDVLVVMDEPTFPGCLITVRLIGVISARQGKPGIRNDRLVGVPQTPVNKPEVRTLKALGRERLEQIEGFFVAYNRAQGRSFVPFARRGPREAERLLDAAIEGPK